MSAITMIETSKLYHHPKNRKDLGDLSELAGSIKQNGVYQNLTVVHYDPVDHKELTLDDPANAYVVVIGNRRLEAAKIAGVNELPCVIASIDLPGQIRAMTEENIMRKDMTIPEQADAFQLLLDLGDTVDDIAKKSGFSATTVRNRLKLTELNRDTLIEAESRGGTLSDYMDLFKIKDETRRNVVLESVGTSNFQEELMSALREQTNAERMDSWIATAETFATKVEQVDYSTMQCVCRYRTCWNDDQMTVPDDKGTVKYMYTSSGNEVAIYRERMIPVKTPEEIAKEQAEAERNTEHNGLMYLAKIHYDLRQQFIKNLAPSVAKKHFVDIVTFWGEQLRDRLVCDMNFLNIYAKSKPLCEALGIQMEKGQKVLSKEQWEDAACRAPEYALLVWAILCVDRKDLVCHCQRWHTVDAEHPFNGYYNDPAPNRKLSEIYDLLGKLGYVMSEQERQLLDGTHPYLVRTTTVPSADPAISSNTGAA